MQSLSQLDCAMGILEICRQSGNENERCDLIGQQFLNQLDLNGASTEVRQAIDHFGGRYNEIMRQYDVDSPGGVIVRDQEDAIEILNVWRQLAEVIRNSESERILKKLAVHGNTLPVAEITEASRHRDWFAPLLLQKLQATVELVFEKQTEESDRLLECLDSEDQLPFLSIYLFAEWNFSDSVPTVLRVLELPDAAIDMLWGDTLFEVAPRYLAQFLASDLDRLDEVIRNQRLDPILRWTIATTYEYLVRDKSVAIEEAVSRLDKIFEDVKDSDDQGYPTAEHPYELSSGIAMTLCNLEGAALSKLSKFDEQDWEFIDESMIDQKSFLELCVVPNGFKLCSTQVNTIAELSSWAWYTPKTPAPNKPIKNPLKEIREDAAMPDLFPPATHDGTFRSGERISRNSPCPCGSGRKFKQCCLNASRITID